MPVVIYKFGGLLVCFLFFLVPLVGAICSILIFRKIRKARNWPSRSMKILEFNVCHLDEHSADVSLRYAYTIDGRELFGSCPYFGHRIDSMTTMEKKFVERRMELGQVFTNPQNPAESVVCLDVSTNARKRLVYCVLFIAMGVALGIALCLLPWTDTDVPPTFPA